MAANWMLIIGVLIINLGIIGLAALFIWEHKTAKQEHLQSMKDGSYISTLFKKWFLDPEASMSVMTNLPPGREREKVAQGIFAHYATLEGRIVNFFLGEE